MRLERGETFRGTVSQVRESGEVTVLARGSKLTAFATTRLQPGRSYLFMVDRAGRRTVLHVLEGREPPQNQPLRLWAEGRGARMSLGRTLASLADASKRGELPARALSSLEALRNRLPALVYQGGTERPVDWTGRQLLRSGMFLEHRLARLIVQGKEGSFQRVALSDLKGILSALREGLRQAENTHEAARAMTARVDQAFHLIENDQLLNLSSLKENLGWYWFIPGRDEEGFKGADIFVEQPGDEEQGIRLALSVEFTTLGRLDALLLLNPSSVLGVRLTVGDSEAAGMMNAHMWELTRSLEEAGIRTGEIFCRERREDEPEWAPFMESFRDRGAVDLTA